MIIRWLQNRLIPVFGQSMCLLGITVNQTWYLGISPDLLKHNLSQTGLSEPSSSLLIPPLLTALFLILFTFCIWVIDFWAILIWSPAIVHFARGHTYISVIQLPQTTVFVRTPIIQTSKKYPCTVCHSWVQNIANFKNWYVIGAYSCHQIDTKWPLKWLCIRTYAMIQ